MLNQLERLTQEVGGSHSLIDQWLEARKALLVTYYDVIGLQPQKEKQLPLDKEALKRFCHSLVDYLSAGHFQIYDKIIRQTEGVSSTDMAVSAKIYPAIEANTQSIMAFYDRFSSEIDQESCLALQQALSDVAEALAARFTLEDTLIGCAVHSWLLIHSPTQSTEHRENI